MDRDKLASVLAQPYALFVEEQKNYGQEAEEWEAPLLTNGFMLSLTTATAYRLQSPVLLCDALIQREVLSLERRSVVELCLHEAVANAIIHGNLEISSSAKDHPEGHRVFSQMVNEQLRKPELCRRRVTLFASWNEDGLEVGVIDQGLGFNVSALPTSANNNARSGRGFIFMKALASSVRVSNGGRCTTLRFAP
ncbi:serine/threonine-protein kinase RsbW [Azospirillaceae bacterium]